jgi:long-chain acyl-CoA synthetase
MMAVVPRVLEKIQDRISETVRQSSPAKQKLFRWSVGVSRDHFAHRLAGRVPHLGLRLRHVLADRLVGAKIRAGMGGRLRLMISGAAPLTRELAEFFHAVGLPVYEGYGLTETSPVISVNYPGRMKLGTVGPVIPGVEVKLGEPADEEGVSGQEILVRGANVTSGYFHRDDDTRAAFVDGWFRTGDLGTLDAEGFLTITGRRKTLFKTSGGKYVAPEKLESLFQGNPYVAQILVVGEARRFVSALIVPRFERLEELAREQGIAFRGKDDLAAHPAIRTLIEKEIERVTEPLAPHEKIRQFALLPQESTVSSGEMTPSLKIKRRVLEARYREMIEAIYRREEPGASPAHGFAH